LFCWSGWIKRNAGPERRPGDVLVIPKVATDLKTSREEFFRIMTNPKLFR
jgi:hypothetical protein